MFGGIYSLLSRKRELYESEDASKTIEDAFSFLNDNISTIQLTSSSMELINFIQESRSKSLTPNDLFSCKFLLAQSGLDLLIYSLDDTDSTNVNSIPEGTFEYNLMDKNLILARYIPSTMKVNQLTEDSNMNSIYSSILEASNVFEGMPDSRKTVLGDQINTLKGSEELTGKTIPGLSSYIGNIFEYLGKEFHVIKAQSASL